MPEAPALPQQASIHQRVDLDIYRRALPLIPIFVVAWAALALSTGFAEIHHDIAYLIFASFGGVCVFQVLFGLVSSKLYRLTPGFWRFLFYGSTFAQGIMWGLLFAACFYAESFAEMLQPMTFITAGIAGFALSSFAPSRWVAQSYTTLLLLPSAFICVANQGDIIMGVLVITFWLASLLTLQRFHKEYLASFTQEHSLDHKNSELQRQNRTDGLTKVFNRRYFDEALAREWQQGVEEGTWLGLLFVDIDYFKKINDTYGHQAGDECLVQVASVINGAVQSGSDIVARYGGEEFAVLLPRTQPEMAERIAESIRRQFGLREFCFDKTCIKITASIGVSSMVPSASSDPTVLLDQADQGVYAAKAAGRNNVQLFGARI